MKTWAPASSILDKTPSLAWRNVREQTSRHGASWRQSRWAEYGHPCIRLPCPWRRNYHQDCSLSIAQYHPCDGPCFDSYSVTGGSNIDFGIDFVGFARRIVKFPVCRLALTDPRKSFSGEDQSNDRCMPRLVPGPHKWATAI